MRWLTGRGAAAAVAVGLAVGYGFGWRGVLLLLAFFVSGSVLSEPTQRNAWQVLANGGVAAVAALAGSWVACAGSLAAATADTWASEIGRRSRTPPRLITDGRPVPAGTDGGITVLGTLGGVAGALFMGGLAFAFESRSALAVAVAGVLGMLLDSVLGATLQGALRWLDNDGVNLAATLGGAALALLAAHFCC